MRTAELDTTTLYAYRPSFGSPGPARVLALASWYRLHNYGAADIYSPTGSTREFPGWTVPYNGTKRGIPVIALRNARLHREDDELIRRAYDAVAPLFARGAVKLDDARAHLISTLGEDDAKLVEFAIVRPQAFLGEWQAHAEREAANRKAARERVRAREAAEAQNAEERDLAYAAVRELIGEDEMPVRSDQRYSSELARASMPWETLTRLIALARAAGQADAAKAIAEAEATTRAADGP